MKLILITSLFIGTCSCLQLAKGPLPSPLLGLVPSDAQLPRSGRTLTGVFPFSERLHHAQGQHGHHDHHDDHHGEHHEAPHESLPRRDALQIGHFREGEEQEEESNDIDIAAVAESGERCVEKVMMVEELQYDEQIECHHSYDKRCHTTYSTDYEPQQEEDCDENFVKNCYIEYKTVAFDEKVEICNENLVRNCDLPGETVCETVYESQCETTYHEHEVEEDVPECRTMQIEKCKDVVQGYRTVQECEKWPKQVCTLEQQTVKRYSPETQCRKVPRDVCGPGPCPIEPGPEDCREETKTLVQEVPEETCDLQPQKVCKFITKLVPVLKPKENCVDIPKEVCARMRRNPRKVNRPVIKKWCYIPSEESGLLEADEEAEIEEARTKNNRNIDGNDNSDNTDNNHNTEINDNTEDTVEGDNSNKSDTRNTDEST